MGFGKDLANAIGGGSGSEGGGLGGLFKDKFPVAGALGDMIFGGNKQQGDITVNPNVAAPPPVTLPDMDTSDYSGMIGMNAKPKESGVADILKMFFM